MQDASEDEAYRRVNMTHDQQLELQNCLSDNETEARTWNMAGTERIIDQLERENYTITSCERKRFNKEFSIRLIEFEI